MAEELSDDVIELIAQRFRVLGDPTRIKLLNLLRGAELTVNELTQASGGTQQNVSKHLGVLHGARIVSRRKVANRAYYAIADDMVFQICEEVCGSIQRQHEALAQIMNEVTS